MFATKPVGEILFRVLMISVLLLSGPLNAFSVQAAQTTETATAEPTVTSTVETAETPTVQPTATLTETSTPSVTETPAPATETITPAATDTPHETATNPVTTETASPVASDTPVLTLSSDPGFITPAGVITLYWIMEGITTEGLTLQFVLPEGFSPLGDHGGLFDETTRVLVLTPSVLNGELQLRTGSPENDVQIEASLLQNGILFTNASLFIPAHEQFIMDTQGGEIIARDGKVKIQFPENALPERAVIEIGRPAGGSMPARALSSAIFEINAFTERGRRPLHSFDKNITLAVNYTDLGIPADQADNLRVVWFNEEKGDWEYLPTSVDVDTETAYAVTDHFTVFDLDMSSWQASRVPTIDAFQVSSFTGAATYSLPIEVPPGPAGLQPELVLNYNSQVVDQSTSETQASWVGMGWSLDTGSIERYTNGSNGGVDDTFFLNVNGVSSRIVRDPNGVYHLSDENFWKISYAGGSPSSWVVYDKNGNKYTFGATATSVATMVYNAGILDGCGEPEIHTLDYRWELTSVTNTFGQQIIYDYVKESRPFTWESGEVGNCNHHSLPTDTAIYPKTIQYANNRYQVSFELEARTDYKTAWVTEDFHFSFMKQRLSAIYVKHDSDANGTFETIVRKYDLTYLSNTDPGLIWPGISWTAGGKTTTLAQVQEFGVGGTQALPAQTFKYGDNMHLTRAENGYGGKVEFDYNLYYYAADGRYSQTRYDRVNVRATSASTRPSWPAGSCWNGSPKWTKKTATDYIDCDDGTLYIKGTAVSTWFFGNEMFRPGGVYKLSASMWTQNATLTTGLFDGTSDLMSQGGIVILPKTASKMQMLLKTGTNQTITLATAKIQLLTAVYRVQTKRLFDGKGNQYNYTYTYSNPAVNDLAYSTSLCPIDPFDQACYEYVEKYSEFRGHGQVIETGPDGMKTVTSFYQDDVRKGRPTSIAIQNNTNQLYSKKDFSYSWLSLPVDSPGHNSCSVCPPDYIGVYRNWVYTSNDTITIYGTVISYARVAYTYDTSPATNYSYGNLITKTDQSSTNGTNWSTYRYQTHYYVPNNSATRYLVGLPAKTKIFDAAGNTLGITLYLYDGNTGDHLIAPVDGKLTTVRSLAQNGTQYSQVSYTYDARGNRNSTTVYKEYAPWNANPTTGPSYTTYTCYGGEGGGYILGGTTCANVGTYSFPLWSKNPLGHISSWTYDYSKGVPLTETDSNGNITSAEYDYFGRMTKLIRPGDSSASPTISMTYQDSFPFTTNITQKIDGTQSYTVQRVYDGMGRQTKITGGGIIVDTIYETATVTKQSVPYQGTSPNQFTITTVNPAARTTTVQAPDGTSMVTATNGLVTTVTDTRGNITTSTSDVWGRVVLVEPPTGTGPSVTYTYDKLDRLETATRGGAVTAIKYDNAGRKINMDDPDMGMAGTPTDNNWAWTYQYDALGNLTSQTDARGCTLSLGYDPLNRLTSKSSTGSGCSVQISASYTYDAGTNSKGRRTSMSDGSGSTAWSYDTRGRMLMESKAITGAGTFDTSWTYNSADLPITITYPDGEVVTNNYNNRMLLNSVLGTGTYVSSTTYDTAGRIDLRTFGNNTQTDYVYYPWTSQGGRLLNIKSGTSATPTSLQSLEYAYDAAGNVDWIKDWKAGAPQLQDFGYDALDRLTSAVVSGGSSGLYNETYTYSDTTGNLINKGGLALQYNNASHVHAVTNAGSNTYGYDANGSMTSRVVSGQTFGLAYDAENRLVSVSGSGAIPTSTPAPTNTPTPTATNTPTPTPTSSATRVAYWKFEETASPWTDSTGRGHSLSQVAGSVTSIAGKVGNGLNNVSTTTDLQTASHTDFDFTRSEGFTIETWARTSNTDGTYWHMLFGKRGPAGGTIVRAGHWGSAMIFTVRTSTGQNKGLWYETPRPVNDGQWHHWVFFLDATNIGYWMDGELVFSEPHGLTSGDFSAAVPFDVMNDTYEVNRWLGDVDEFAVYKGVLSQAEIVDHYNNGAGKYYASVTEAPEVAQAPVSDYKTVSYILPKTNSQVPVNSPLQQTSTIASYTYDGDGRQVKAVVGGVTTYYVGSHYQVENGVVTKYYFAGAQRVAMRKNGTLYYLLADHLGSTSLTTNTSGALVSELRYKAWGETRYSSGTTPTSYRYTGQREEPGIGLYFYNARWYDPYLNHFTQPDSIVPDPNNSQDWDRYAYARNNPVRYTDPSGHGVDCGIGMGCVKDYTGAKTLKDFRDMGWNERKHWLADIVHENDLGHWFDDMLGAIDFMAHNPSLSQQGGTAEVMDAAVLQAINDGLLITKGSDPFGGGGQGWADFFKERQDSNDEDHLIATRLRAEQQGVNYAWGLASTQSAFGNSTQSDQIFFRLFKTGADSYRSSAIAYRLGTPYSTMAVQYGAPQFTGPLVVTATGIMTDPRTSGPGLVGIGVLTWGLYDHTFGVLIK